MKQGGVSSRVALLLRSTEPQPSLLDLSFHQIVCVLFALASLVWLGESVPQAPRVNALGLCPCGQEPACWQFFRFSKSLRRGLWICVEFGYHSQIPSQSSECAIFSQRCGSLSARTRARVLAKCLFLKVFKAGTVALR